MNSAHAPRPASRLAFPLALAAIVLGAAAAYATPQQPAVGLLLMLLGGLVLAWDPDDGQGLEAGIAAPQRRRAWEPAFVVLLLVLAAAPRFYQLDQHPDGAYGHEGEMVDQLHNGLAGSYEGLVGHADINWPSLIFYQGWASTRVFGEELKAWRYPNALWGVLAVLAFFFAARMAVSAEAAALAAVMLAGFSQQIHFSRQFFPAGPVQFAVPATLGLAWLALRRRQAWLMGLAGFAAGVGFNGFIPGRAVAPLLFAWIGWLWLTRRDLLPKRAFAWAFAGFLIPMLPLIWWGVIQHPGGLWGAYLQHSNPNEGHGPIGYLGTFFRQLPVYARMFQVAGDPSSADTVPYRALLDPVSGALLGLGFFAALRAFWRPLPAFALGWMVAGLSAAMLSSGFPHPTFRRVLMMHGAIYLLIALAFERLRLGLAVGAPAWRKGLFWALAIATAVFAYQDGLKREFVGYASNDKALSLRNMPATAAGRLMRAHPDAAVWSVPGWANALSTPILIPRVQVNNAWEMADLLFMAPGKDAVVLMDYYSDGMQDFFSAAYPHSTTASEPRRTAFDNQWDRLGRQVELRSAFIPAEDIVARRDLSPERHGSQGRLSVAFRLGRTGAVITLSSQWKGWSAKLNGAPVAWGRKVKAPGGIQWVELSGPAASADAALEPLQAVLEDGRVIKSPDLARFEPRGLLLATYASRDHFSGPSPLLRQELEPHFQLPDPTDSPTPFSVRISGRLQLPSAGSWGFELDPWYRCRIRVDGQTFFDSMDPQSVHRDRRMLAQGPHRFEVDFDPGVEGAARRTFSLYVRRPGTELPEAAPGSWFRPW